MPIRKQVLGLAASVGLGACSTAHIDQAMNTTVEQIYDEAFPYYTELCAVSELKKKPGFGADISSGMGGHSILYLNGVCRDPTTDYPVIHLCGPNVPSAKRGVGLSVNAHFKNANWVAIEGRDFVFRGTLQPGERLTRAVYEETQARAKEMGIYNGVEFHADVFDDIPKDMPRQDYKYEVSVSTDYAIAFGRDRYCARVPLSRARMQAAVDYLNNLNKPYRAGREEFEWNVFNNNCVHVAHNALAAAGVWNEWPMGEFVLFAAFDFPVPKNEFVDLMRRTNDMPIDDPEALYADAAARRALLQTDSLPTEPGALAEAEPAVQDNDIYGTDLRLIFYDDPLFGTYAARFARIFSDARYTDLRTNLAYFAAAYRRAKHERALTAAHDAIPESNDSDRSRFYKLYDAYIAKESERVSAELASPSLRLLSGESLDIRLPGPSSGASPVFSMSPVPRS
jgi:hypothetical protein